MAYTTANRVREEFAFLLKEENQTGKTGTDLTLKERAYAIQSVNRDGVALVETTDFAFLPSRTISLTVAAVTTDQYNIEYHTNLNTQTLADLITKAERKINSRMVRVFGESIVPWTVAPNIIEEITTELTGCLAMRSMTWKNGIANQEFHSQWMDMKKHVDMMLEEIEEGRMEVIGESPTGDTQITVGNTGTQLFVPLEDKVDSDYFRNYNQDSRATRNDTEKVDP